MVPRLKLCSSLLSKKCILHHHNILFLCEAIILPELNWLVMVCFTVRPSLESVFPARRTQRLYSLMHAIPYYASDLPLCEQARVWKLSV